MPGIHDLPLFLLSCLLLNLTPGADSLFIALRSATQGFRAGVAASLGICAGCFVHVTAAALGLSALLAGSALAFTLVKLLGAVYLIWMGLTLLFRKTDTTRAAPASMSASLLVVFRQGFLTNALNPKVALFFLAFVPQFIAPDAPHKAAAFLFLGSLFTAGSALYGLLLAGLSARAARLGPSRRLGIWLSRLAGGVFLALGLRLATTD